MRAFASDNYAPILPEALDAIAAVNHGHAVSYGADETTARLQTVIKRHFGGDAAAFPVFNGTGANVVGLRAMLRPWQGVICAESAHLNVDEGGAPETLAGIKLLTVPTPDGKLTPELVDRWIVRIGDEHVVQPGVVIVTQSTELGTRYSLEELRGAGASTPARTGCCSTSTARGWRTRPPRSTSALGDVTPVGADVLSLRRHQDRPARGRGRGRPQPRAHPVAAVPAQAVDAAGVEDALRQRPAARALRGRRCGAGRRATPTRWRRGWRPAWGRR